MSLTHISDDEDEVLAKVQEESLRHYQEFELPRLKDDSRRIRDASISPSREEDGTKQTRSSNSTPGIVSMEAFGDSNVLCTQVGGKAGALLFEGEGAKGFHLAAGSTYIYPTNYPIRQYQSAIVRSALFKNTLVGLPTGLGKTFIAAVVMYNFYRWYPRGKVVFMAPTRPLVAQQIKACYVIMGIPPDDTTEMTGVQPSDVREKLWKEKRVFFLTPQVMANDLRSNICPASSVKCLVLDEAHKAVKDYAYCHVVKLLSAAGSVYRTLALSATPGNDINSVIKVIENLNISCLEMRGENSIDVAQYTHGKSIEPVVLDLSPEILRVKDDFMRVYEKFARNLIENRALTSNIAYQSKFQILKSMEKFRANPPRGMSTSLIGSLVSDFTMCMTFAHALELLQIYGLRAFYRYLADEVGEKSKSATTRLKNNEDLQRLLQKLHGVLYPNPNSDVPYTWGHPKLKKLVHSLSAHFKTAEEKGEKTKAIVFCQYKVVVNEIVDLLVKCKPHVQAALFVGQSGGKERGMPQSKQLQIMKDFREGKINCLVATCVAEEGLDIGEVDLIVLMESQKSPVRLVQRLGRTGRKRRGRCVVLLTRGKEEAKFHEAMASRKSYVQNIVESKAVRHSLCQYSPPMFPPGVKPSQQLVHIKVACIPTPSKPVKASKKQMDIRECAVVESHPFLDDEEAKKVEDDLGGTALTFNQLPPKVELWHRRSGPSMKVDELLNGDTKQLSYWNDWNTELHKAFVISNTQPSETFSHLMAYNAHLEDDEYLKLIEAYETGVTLPKERKDGPSRTTDAPDEGDEERRKKPKKKPAPKRNYGMDIRSCMAAVVQKPHKRARLDSTDDDVIVVEAEDDAPHCADSAVPIPDEINGEEKLLPVGKRSAHSSRKENLDVAGIFGMTVDEFEDALYSEDMLCGLEADIGMCLRLGKMFDGVPAVPKPESFNVSDFKFQCDQLLKLVDSVKGVTFGPTVTETSEAFVEKPSHGTNSPVQPEFGNVDEKREIAGNMTKNDSFVDIDDLFGDDDVFNNVDLLDGETSQKRELDEKKACAPLLEKHKTDVENIVEPSPIRKYNESSLWGSSSVFAELSPVGNAPKVDRPLMSSTPINPRKPVSNVGRPLGQPPKDQDNLWVLDEILEEDDALGKSEIPKGSSGPHSSKDLFATTPAGKVAERAPASSKASKQKSDSDEDVWCLDDLFEDEIPGDVADGDRKNETSFYGITQMVSQIERDKMRKRLGNVSDTSKGVVPSELSGAMSCRKLTSAQLPNENSSSRKGDREATWMCPKLQGDGPRSSLQLLDTNRTLTEKPLPSFHILDSEDTDCTPPEPITESLTDPKSQHKPIVVVDSHSCSPPMFGPKDDQIPDRTQSDRTRKSNEAGVHLLDEDDDVFNMLCDDEEVKLKSASNEQPPQPQNSKKFKRKSLMCHLDSEPENDFPPKKRHDSLDETFNLRVGCSSKRKLSFEEFLGDTIDGASRFASKPPKGPEKATKLSCRRVSAECAKPIPKTSRSSPSDEDIFIRPLVEKSRVGSSSPRTETIPSTSVSQAETSRKQKKKKTSKRKANAFIENEADESGTISTDDSDNSSLDDIDDSFVNDESDQELSYAHYLKTVKSPVAGGRFKIPMSRRYMGNVYSQVVNNIDDEYENDSFCVDSDEGYSPEESTILERAERKLAKKSAAPRKKRIAHHDSSDSDGNERVADLNVLTALPAPNPMSKRRLLESDSDVTPERPPPKRPRNRIVSPMEGEKTPVAVTPTTSADSVVSDAKETLPVSKTQPTPAPAVIVDTDSDEDLKEAIRLSVVESIPKKSADEQFEEDLQKAIFLSQSEVAGPSKPVDNCPSPGDRGTIHLFTSQPILLDRKPLSTKSRANIKPTHAKGSRIVIELSDSD